jgi:2',3'-cyclic-nucleotide 2'-phosphodiesterase (5'-nucleotidase family)
MKNMKLILASLLSSLAIINSIDFHDINIFVVTDTHSWMNGHTHADSFPTSDSTYGNLTSFVTKMKEKAAQQNKDIFFFDNGDVVDGNFYPLAILVFMFLLLLLLLSGTGLSNASPIDGQELFPLLMEVPFDAMAIGNNSFQLPLSCMGLINVYKC